MSTETTLDWLRTDGPAIRDSAGRAVILRGMVVITRRGGIFRGDYLPGERMPITEADYDRMAGWGMNCQVIRVESCAVGAFPGSTPDPEYLAWVDRLVGWAAARGIYTVFKMTFYDVPRSLFPSPTPVRNPRWWQMLWEDLDGTQARLAEGWGNLWRRYDGQPAVAGYDLINEPAPGPAPDHRFTPDYLVPAYQRLIAALQRAAPRQLAFVQPRIGAAGVPQSLGPIGAGVVYAPHWYPRFWVFSTPDQRQEALNQFQETAREMGAPLWIGEWGDMFPEELLRDRRAEAYWGAACRVEMDQLDAAGLGFARPWYEWEGRWATMYDATHERRWLTDQIVRPYPQRIGGELEHFMFDPEAGRFAVRARLQAGQAVEIALPARHVPGGFRASAGGLRLAVRTRQPGASAEAAGLRLTWQRDQRRLTLSGTEDCTHELIVEAGL